MIPLRPFAAWVLLLVLCACDSLDRSEADWNAAGVWKARPGDSRTYVPRDLPASSSMGSESGDWVTDSHDDSRFFVPHQGTPGYPVGLLRVEAWKATNRQTWRRKQTVRLPELSATWSVLNVDAAPEQDSVQSEVSEPISQDDDLATPNNKDDSTAPRPTDSGRSRDDPPDDPTIPPTPAAPPSSPEQLPRPDKP